MKQLTEQQRLALAEITERKRRLARIQAWEIRCLISTIMRRGRLGDDAPPDPPFVENGIRMRAQAMIDAAQQ